MQTLAIFSCRDSLYDKYINCIEIGYKFTAGTVGALTYAEESLLRGSKENFEEH